MPTRANVWAKLKRLKLIAERGSCCELCGSTEKLQFAHLKPTKLSGCGRGLLARVLDIYANPEAYILLCEKCHKELDRVLNG